MFTEPLVRGDRQELFRLLRVSSPCATPSHFSTFIGIPHFACPPSQWLQARTRTPEKLELTDKLAKAVVLHNLQVVLTPPPVEETKGGRRRFSFHEGAAPLMVPPLELDELAQPHFDRFNTGPSGPTVSV
jgi:hypothetical protein